MTIQQAIKTGKPFRRKDRQDLWTFVLPLSGMLATESVNDDDTVSFYAASFRAESLLATDWEVKDDTSKT